MQIKKFAKGAILIVLISFIVVGFVGPALAAIPVTPPNNVPTSTLPDLINTISSVILLLVGIVAVLFLIIGGFRYITASGVPEQVQSAKGTIMYAIIGIMVALLSYAIVQYVITQIKLVKLYKAKKQFLRKETVFYFTFKLIYT